MAEIPSKSKKAAKNRKERRAAESRAKTAERGKSGEGPRRKLHERRFDAPGLTTTPLALAGGALGALALGAGVHGQWVRDEPLAYAAYLIAGGAAALIAALVLGDSAAYPVRVGDAGVAVEKAGETARILWCDVDSIALEGGDLVVKSKDLSLRIPVKLHGSATSWVVKEAAERIPEQLALSDAERASLPAAPTAPYERLAVEGLQLAGRECAASGKLITLEADGRMCPACGQVYHRQQVPATCVTCDQPLSGRVLRLS